ncbi:MAG: hypothetical protein EOO07_23860, partial [Chitinophagaceae bacterium]
MFTRTTKLLLATGVFIAHTSLLLAQEKDSLTTAQTDSLVQVSAKKMKGPRVEVKVVDAATGKPLSGISVS